jgi:hypothetical protein
MSSLFANTSHDKVAAAARVFAHRSSIRRRAISDAHARQAVARRSSGAKTRSSRSFAKCTGHIETLRWSAAAVSQRAQLRSASSIALRPGRVSSMATDPPAPFRPTTWQHISSSEAHILESALRGISSICVSCALIMLSGSRKAIHSRGRPKPSGPIRARQRRHRSPELRIAGSSWGRPRVGIPVMGKRCRAFQRPRTRRNAPSPESGDI